MAEKPKLDIFSKTTTETDQVSKPVDLSDLEDGIIRQTGVGLRTGEIEALDAIGSDLGGVSRNALIRYGVRLLIREYRAGRLNLEGDVETPPIPKKRLRMPK